MPRLTNDAINAWSRFLHVNENRGHVSRGNFASASEIERYVTRCWASAQGTVNRVLSWMGFPKPRHILDLGCSSGMNALAFAKRCPAAHVWAIEPEYQALEVAQTMAVNAGVRNLTVCRAYGEELPFRDHSFDLINCFTVIEHVQDVEGVISQMARVLAPGGVIYLEAPNYRWPREPHLEIWTAPILGKRFIRWSAIAQGKRLEIPFLGHLQLVTPGRIEQAFASNGLRWRNLVCVKASEAAKDGSQVVAYPRLGQLLHIANRTGLLSAAVWLMEKTGFYPSLMYAAGKP
ncbi:MAG: class I SAM-dependent methyltransferase [Nitrospira sp.]